MVQFSFVKTFLGLVLALAFGAPSTRMSVQAQDALTIPEEALVSLFRHYSAAPNGSVLPTVVDVDAFPDPGLAAHAAEIVGLISGAREDLVTCDEVAHRCWILDPEATRVIRLSEGARAPSGSELILRVLISNQVEYANGEKRLFPRLCEVTLVRDGESWSVSKDVVLWMS